MKTTSEAASGCAEAKLRTCPVLMSRVQWSTPRRWQVWAQVFLVYKHIYIAITNVYIYIVRIYINESFSIWSAAQRTSGVLDKR